MANNRKKTKERREKKNSLDYPMQNAKAQKKGKKKKKKEEEEKKEKEKELEIEFDLIGARRMVVWRMQR